ncbi:MAG: xylulokinase, partial [Phycisphaerales bacterium]|nr:xylulokinase [Phycisphaerales bacterium]
PPISQPLMYFLGIDSGTQSTKAIVLDLDTGKIVATGHSSYDLIDGLPPGHLEQNPQDWIDAVDASVQQCLEQIGSDKSKIAGIGVSGQQHGLVALGADDKPVRAAKLWCDTSTQAQCAEIAHHFGGQPGVIAVAGNAMLPGYTIPKLLWMKQNEPENFAKTKTILLPHDYINFWLSGVKRMEYGDASGMGILNVNTREWAYEICDYIDPSVRGMLPPLGSSKAVHGTIRKELAGKWGLSYDVIISAGGGDNMMGAIGTGNIKPGVVTASFGTSGTLYGVAASPVVDGQGEVAAFCDSTDQWLPLVCTMNATVATELTKRLLSMDSAQLDAAVNSVAAGADGLLLIPYFQGERTPNVPDGSGVWFGATARTMTPAHFARAAMEGATLGLAFGLNRLRDLGVVVNEIRLTGGGANSAIWRKICADVFQAPVIRLESAESAAFGAAIQAKWVHERLDNRGAAILDVTRAWVRTMEQSRVEPEATNAGRYQELAAIHDEISASLRDAFSRHRRLIERG